MRFLDIEALSRVNNTSPFGKAAHWSGAGPYPLTLDPEAVTTIEPYRGSADATSPEAIVDGYYTMTLTGGQTILIDAIMRGVIVATRNAA